MKKTLIPIGLAGASAAFILRTLQRGDSYDAAGLIPRGDKTSLTLYLICALAAVLVLIVCLREPKGVHVSAGKSRTRGLLVIAAALALLGACLPLEGGVRLVVSIFAFAAACAMAAEGVFHMHGHTGSLLGGCLLPVYLAAALISDYRGWSYDPLVADFCFPLLFIVSAMLASYHLAAFRAGRGKRRTTAFYVGCALVFAGAVLADLQWRTIVRTVALCVYLCAELWPYLAAPIEAEEAEETEEAPTDE